MNMNNLNPPTVLAEIEAATSELGFTMASNHSTGSLLRTLAASKPGGVLLELGTGTGISTAWLLDGMCAGARLISVDIDEEVMAVARRYLARDPRVSLFVAEGAALLDRLQGQTFDLIFADTTPGKYLHLDRALSLLNLGGLYVLNDMLPQPTWPPGHDLKVGSLIEELEARPDLRLTKLEWSTGLIIAAQCREYASVPTE